MAGRPAGSDGALNDAGAAGGVFQFGGHGGFAASRADGLKGCVEQGRAGVGGYAQPFDLVGKLVALAVFGGDAFSRKKPDPLPLQKTCQALATAPQRTLMIGDSSNDAQAARAAGCPVLLVTYGYNHGEPIRGVDADAFVDSLQQLLVP